MNAATNKVWFITGASRGFGALIAKQALERGDCVVATARRPADVVDALGAHPELLALRLDVTDERGAAAAAEQAIERFGRIDILLNNAGYGLLAAVEEASADEVRKVFDTNVFGLLHVTRAITPYMREKRRGHIINISSIGGYAAYPGWGVYGATKFAVEGLTEALAAELAPLGIHATVVEPGFFRTDFLDASSLVTSERSIGDYAGTVGATREFASGANHRQPGDPRKLAAAIMVLADSAKPPVRLPLGSDTVARIRAKNRFVEAELQQSMALSMSTDAANAA
jgi:NAD(P)-dependent dehydrogenase (short-subunit alcohol dehydrogenase family)